MTDPDASNGRAGDRTTAPDPAADPADPADPDGSAEAESVVAAAPVNGFEILAAVAGLPVSTWRYEWEPAEVRHLGPMAQDWHAAFGLGGDDDTRIPVVDAMGVLLVAVQALHHEVTELRARLDSGSRADPGS